MSGTAQPAPDGITELTEFGARLRELRVWSGVSYRELHRRVVRSRTARGVAEVPAYDTVYRCLQPGRSRLDVELVVDVVRALTGDADECVVLAWRQAYQLACGAASDAAVVNVTDRLPDDLDVFVGRAKALAKLRPVLHGRSRPVVVAVDGMAGVGKTRLIVHLAHQLEGVDQVLAVNMRGYDPRQPAEPGAVLDAFLRVLGVRGAPQSARTARLAQALAGKRSVILLDNAGSAEQVLPLLPGVPGSVVLVTSRRHLELPGAERLQLGPFTPAESDDLLRRSIGSARVSADPATAGRIAVQVGQLPLALALVAGRIDATPTWSLSDHLERLVERGRTLCLDDAVEIALAQSDGSLPDDHRTLLRMLALHPGADFDTSAAAALAGVDEAGTAALLSDLLAGSLLQQRSPGRFEMHDLVRVYAARRGSDEDPASARRAAFTRLADHYRAMAALAMSVYAPYEAEWRPPKTTAAEAPADRDAALAWLETERVNLVACALRAAEQNLADHTADLSWILYRYLDDAGHYTDGEALHAAAARATSGAKRGRALSSLGVVHWRLGRFDAAREVYGESLALASASGNHREHIRALINLGLVLERVGAYTEAYGNYLRSIEIAATIGSHLGTAHALHNVVVLAERLGRYDEAYERVQECLSMLLETGDRVTEGRALNSRAGINLSLGRYDQARADAEAAISIARETANRTGEAYALITLGRALCALGALDPARSRLELALKIAGEVANRDAEALALNESGTVACTAGSAATALERHRAALAISTEVGDPYEQARSHQGCARALVLLGDPATAQAELRQALTIFDRLKTPEANAVATQLAALSA
ncbi:tetratricopeptide repeat protein [Kribbella albertanoniae]|uniref:Tetratricopeptide repeat protein n=1 Tax=Kribbella albertanoniae TaxID=1266829 RepID=A0A4R4P7U7_9ACTN|nr:tetratricopeptide repeat protein [Kribbella albertanoniae]TDC18598.1 tetratricopeptide repeat protein [Kribbella albertanoniae]